MAVTLADLLTPRSTAAPQSTAPPRPASRPSSDEVADVRVLLEDARAVVHRGWVQDAWFLVRGRRGRLRPIRPGHLGRIDHTNVTAACLVGAIIHAGWRHRTMRGAASAPTGPALDTVWHTLHESEVEIPSTSPWERAARSRDLSRWNDAPGRGHADVLALLDAAILRTYASSEIVQECGTRRPALVT